MNIDHKVNICCQHLLKTVYLVRHKCYLAQMTSIACLNVWRNCNLTKLRALTSRDTVVSSTIASYCLLFIVVGSAVPHDIPAP